MRTCEKIGIVIRSITNDKRNLRWRLTNIKNYILYLLYSELDFFFLPLFHVILIISYADMKSFLATTAVIAATAQAALTEKQYSSLFSKFVEVHGKTYETKDMFRRYATFKSNVDYILDHNSQENNTFTLGVNQFADMTVEEFRKFIRADPDEDDPAAPLVDGSCLRCKKSSLMAECTANARNATVIDKYFEKPSMPKPLNGRRRNLVEEGFVTDVRNQGQCGSCYAFAAVGVIESAILVAYDNKVPGARDALDLSEQQMVDCTKFAPYNNGGCSGGLPYEVSFLVARVPHRISS